MSKNEISIEIVDIQGTGECSYGHKIGEKFNMPDDRGKICSAAYYSMYPYITTLTYGGSFPWAENKDICTICCPDHKNPVVFKIIRKEVED